MTQAIRAPEAPQAASAVCARPVKRRRLRRILFWGLAVVLAVAVNLAMLWLLR